MENINYKSLDDILEIENGFKIKLINEPYNFLDLMNGSDKNVIILKKLREPVDLIHLFTRSEKELLVEFPSLIKYLKPNGIIWISWPDRNSNHISDLDETLVKKIGLNNGLIDSKTCKIMKDWFATKFVYETNN